MGMIIPFIKNVNFFELAKFMSLQKKSILPKEYKQVEYIESSGTQYIITPFEYDFGISISEQSKYDITIKGSNVNGTSLCGANWGGADRAFNLVGIDGKFSFFMYANNDVINTGIPVDANIHIWKYIDYNLYCDDTFVGTSGKQSPGGGIRAIYLFAMNFGNSPVETTGVKRISRFKVDKDNIPVCDMYSCIRKLDNKPGMYDIITNQFYTNSGTGEFITG